MAGQSLKSSLATQRLTKKVAHTHTKTVQTENMVDGKVVLKGWVLIQKQTRLLWTGVRMDFLIVQDVQREVSYLVQFDLV